MIVIGGPCSMPHHPSCIMPDARRGGGPLPKRPPKTKKWPPRRHKLQRTSRAALCVWPWADRGAPQAPRSPFELNRRLHARFDHRRRSGRVTPISGWQTAQQVLISKNAMGKGDRRRSRLEPPPQGFAGFQALVLEFIGADRTADTRPDALLCCCEIL